MKIIFQGDDGNPAGEVVLDEAEAAAILTDQESIPEWALSFLKGKARKRIDDIVTKSGLGSKFTDADAKKKIILKLQDEGHELMKSATIKMQEEKARHEAVALNVKSKKIN